MDWVNVCLMSLSLLSPAGTGAAQAPAAPPPLGDALRDMAAALSNELLSMVGHRTNEIMKVLTLMASLFIPLTFIAGVYGMNFENMPELRQRYGYGLVLTVMVLVAAGMLIYFKRRGWMGRPRHPRRRRARDD